MTAQRGYCGIAGMNGQVIHCHGRQVHAHPHTGPHRHVLRPRRSQALPPQRHESAPTHPEHSHGLVPDSIKRSREGVRAVALALGVLALTAVAQTLVFVASGRAPAASGS